MEKRELIQAINARTKGRLDNLLVESNICPLCARQEELCELVVKLGEKVCTRCGFVSSTMPSFIEHDGPRISQTGKRPNELAYNDGMGETLGEKGVFFVITRTNGVENAPIRMRQMKIDRFEPLKIRNMKRQGNRRCKEWGFADDPTRSSNFIFSNFFGRVLKRIGIYCMLSGERVSQSLVDACFIFSLRKLKGESAYEEALSRLSILPSFVETVAKIYNMMKLNNTPSDEGTPCIDSLQTEN